MPLGYRLRLSIGLGEKCGVTLAAVTIFDREVCWLGLACNPASFATQDVRLSGSSVAIAVGASVHRGGRSERSMSVIRIFRQLTSQHSDKGWIFLRAYEKSLTGLPGTAHCWLVGRWAWSR